MRRVANLDRALPRARSLATVEHPQNALVDNLSAPKDTYRAPTCCNMPEQTHKINVLCSFVYCFFWTSPEAHIADSPALIPHPPLRPLLLQQLDVFKQQAHRRQASTWLSIEAFSREGELDLEESVGCVAGATLIVGACNIGI